MKTFKLFILFMILVPSGLKAQFTKLESSYSITNSVFNNTEDNAYLFSYSADGLIKFKLNNNVLETVTLDVPQNSPLMEVNALNVINNDVLLIRINEFDKINFVNTYYLTIDGAKNWVKILTPDSKQPIFSYADQSNNTIYFYKSDNTGYFTYNYAAGQWSTIDFSSTPFDIIKMNNGIGYLQLFTAGNDKIGYTKDGGKTYETLSNIDYSKKPFTWADNGILQKITIVTDNHWYAQYEFDSAGIQVSKLMATTDRGSSWYTVMNTNIDQIQMASNNTVYVYKQNGAAGVLYSISNYGTQICATSFTGRIESMTFRDAKNGLIFAHDPATSEYGVWLMTNGGGANCFPSTSMSGIAKSKSNTYGLNVYPNPATTELHILNNTKGTENTVYSIQNLAGQIVLTGILSGIESEINVSSLASGIYVVKAGDAIQKFVKE
jgi:hypothetical protein